MRGPTFTVVRRTEQLLLCCCSMFADTRGVCRLFLAGQVAELGDGGEPSHAPNFTHRVRHAECIGKRVQVLAFVA